MALHGFKKGLDLPIAGAPSADIDEAPQPAHVAIVATDYIGMKPTMFVKVGDAVKRGQTLFEDKKAPGVLFTAPGAGTVVAVNRGERRALQSVVIELNDDEKQGGGEQVAFENYHDKDIDTYNAEEIRALLIESGLWTSLRARPFSRVPQVDTTPHSIFVTAMDTNPLAPSVDQIVSGRESDLNAGLKLIKKLSAGRVYFCRDENASFKVGMSSGAQEETFSGPHPSGTVGLHIHTLDPVSRNKTVWHIGVQDVIAIGALFRTGELELERIISLAGPQVKNPRLLKTRLGASTLDITAGELKDGDNRIVSGSVLNGYTAQEEIHGFLGRFHQQISVLAEGDEREFLGWLGPGTEKFSIINLFVSKFVPDKLFNFTTTTNGSKRAMVPIGLYERVVPMDIVPTYLLRSLIVNDVEKAEQLGCLELDEEDLALCTFVCPGKYEYGSILRRNLTLIEKEG